MWGVERRIACWTQARFHKCCDASQLGISEPNYDVLTAEMTIEWISWPCLVNPCIKPEIALVTLTPIIGSSDDTTSAIAAVHAAIEIVNTRYTEYRFTLIDNTADNS